MPIQNIKGKSYHFNGTFLKLKFWSVILLYWNIFWDTSFRVMILLKKSHKKCRWYYRRLKFFCLKYDSFFKDSYLQNRFIYTLGPNNIIKWQLLNSYQRYLEDHFLLINLFYQIWPKRLFFQDSNSWSI